MFLNKPQYGNEYHNVYQAKLELLVIVAEKAISDDGLRDLVVFGIHIMKNSICWSVGPFIPLLLSLF